MTQSWYMHHKTDFRSVRIQIPVLKTRKQNFKVKLENTLTRFKYTSTAMLCKLKYYFP